MTQLKTKAVLIALILTLGAGVIAILDTIAKGYLYEIRTSIAALQTSGAAEKTALGVILAAINSYRSAEVNSDAVVKAAIAQGNATVEMARATRDAANANAQALRDSTATAYLADNTTFKEFTEPVFLGPAKRIAELNDKIGLFGQPSQGAIYGGLIPSLPETAKPQQQNLDAEIARVQATGAKNIKDTMKMLIDGVGLAGMENLYTSADSGRSRSSLPSSTRTPER